MIMLTELEYEVVRSCEIDNFCAYLQWTQLEYPSLIRDVERKCYPQQTMLKHCIERMIDERNSFDYCYFSRLRDEKVNPLQTEQAAWRLLSPLVRAHTDGFGGYLAGYSPASAEKDPLLAHLNDGLGLVEDWNVISRSYGAKLEKMWDQLEAREQAAKDLIERLSSKVGSARV